jgi:hypothetical protein
VATLPANISGLSDAEKFDLIDALRRDLETRSPALTAEQAEELDARASPDMIKIRPPGRRGSR